MQPFPPRFTLVGSIAPLLFCCVLVSLVAARTSDAGLSEHSRIQRREVNNGGRTDGLVSPKESGVTATHNETSPTGTSRKTQGHETSPQVVSPFNVQLHPNGSVVMSSSDPSLPNGDVRDEPHSCGARLSWCECTTTSVSCTSRLYTRRLNVGDIASLRGAAAGSPEPNKSSDSHGNQDTRSSDNEQPAMGRWPTSVSHLVITDAAMSELGAEIAGTFPALKDMLIETCRIRVVSERAFVGLTQLERLRIANSHVSSLALGTFAKLHKLEVLDLSENLLTRIPAQLFHELPALVNLTLTGNRLREIHPDQFRLSTSLLKEADSLAKKTNPVDGTTAAQSSIGLDNTTGLSSSLLSPPALPLLEHLDLSFNELNYIPTRALQGLNHLKTLDLRRNHLVTLDKAAFMGMPLLESALVAHNPYDCHCGLRWLANELHGRGAGEWSRKNITPKQGALVSSSGQAGDKPLADVDGMKFRVSESAVVPSPFVAKDRGLIRCARPTQDAESPLLTVSSLSDSLACAPPKITTLARTAPPPGSPTYQRSKVTLACSAKGRPSPSVVWVVPPGAVLTNPNRAQYLHDNITNYHGNGSDDSLTGPVRDALAGLHPNDGRKTSGSDSFDSGTSSYLSEDAAYRIVPTGDVVEFAARWSGEGPDAEYILEVSSLRGMSAGQYACVATGPHGTVALSYMDVTLDSPVVEMYFPSLVWGGVLSIVAVAVGIIGGAISGCIDHLSCCGCCMGCRMSGKNLHYERSDTYSLEAAVLDDDASRCHHHDDEDEGELIEERGADNPQYDSLEDDDSDIPRRPNCSYSDHPKNRLKRRRHTRTLEGVPGKYHGYRHSFRNAGNDGSVAMAGYSSYLDDIDDDGEADHEYDFSDEVDFSEDVESAGSVDSMEEALANGLRGSFRKPKHVRGAGAGHQYEFSGVFGRGEGTSGIASSILLQSGVEGEGRNSGSRNSGMMLGGGESMMGSEVALLGEDECLLRESGDLLTGLGMGPEGPDGEEGGSAAGSHKLGGWRTLESLEALRMRLKARVEQMDLAKAKLKARMERRAERMKMNMERRAERMRTGIGKRREKVRNKMATIRTYSSQSLQSIKETSSNYAHKLQSGVRTAVENMGYTVQSLKEFCGTGDPLGQTVSVATIITDVDTEERVQIVRNVTMV